MLLCIGGRFPLFPCIRFLEEEIVRRIIILMPLGSIFPFLGSGFVIELDKGITRILSDLLGISLCLFFESLLIFSICKGGFLLNDDDILFIRKSHFIIKQEIGNILRLRMIYRPHLNGIHLNLDRLDLLLIDDFFEFPYVGILSNLPCPMNGMRLEECRILHILNLVFEPFLLLCK